MQTFVLMMKRLSQHLLTILLACGTGELETFYSASEDTLRQVKKGNI